MKLDRIIQAVPIALVAQAIQLPPATSSPKKGVATELKADAPSLKIAATTDDLPVIEADTPQIQEETISMPIRASASWEGEYESEYSALVVKEALGTITVPELGKLERLQKLRRRLVAPPTMNEILERHRREKLDHELIKVLRKYVRLQPINTTGST